MVCIWDLKCPEGCHYSHIKVDHCAETACTNNAVFPNTCIPSESLELSYVQGRGFLYGRFPVKSLSIESNELSWQKTFHTCSYNSWLEELILASVPPLGASGCLKLVCGCVCTLPQAPFPFADSPLYPSAVINCSPENCQSRGI